MASVFLFVSCNQYDSDSPEIEVVNKFDYSAFNSFKNDKSFKNIIESIKIDETLEKFSTSLERNKYVLNVVNEKIGTNLVFPYLALQLTDYNAEDIFKIATENKWMDKSEINLIKSFVEDVKAKGFQLAVENYKLLALKSNLNDDGVAKRNTFINIVESINYEYPSIFKNVNDNYFAKEIDDSGWRCALAILALTAATANLSTCATIALCGVAIAVHVTALMNVGDQCFAEEDHS